MASQSLSRKFYALKFLLAFLFTPSCNLLSRKEIFHPRKRSLEWPTGVSSLEEIKERAERTADEVKTLEAEVKRLRKKSSLDQENRRKASFAFRNGKSSYEDLKAARTTARKTMTELVPKETALREKKRTLYLLNKASRSSQGPNTIAQRKEEAAGPPNVEATWSKFKVEQTTERLNIQNLLTNSRGGRRLVTFAGTDYGIATMSETSPQTIDDIQEHVNRFSALQNEDQILQAKPLSEIKLPKAFKIIADQINEASFTRRLGKRRERRLKKEK
jgi:ribosome-binding ATPase YchF (GTP1/OBG family)